MVYTGTACTDVLRDFQNCLPDRQSASDIYIALREHEEQEAIEIEAQQLQTELQFLEPSHECKQAVVPFLCLYLFRVCDSTGKLHHPSYNQCVYISTDICAREWRQATEYLGSGVLPSCESFPAVSSLCGMSTC